MSPFVSVSAALKFFRVCGVTRLEKGLSALKAQKNSMNTVLANQHFILLQYSVFLLSDPQLPSYVYASP